jgi:hypothetical protein
VRGGPRSRQGLVWVWVGPSCRPRSGPGCYCTLLGLVKIRVSLPRHPTVGFLSFEHVRRYDKINPQPTRQHGAYRLASRDKQVRARPMSSPDSQRERSRSPKHAEERERRPHSPKHAGERSRSPKHAQERERRPRSPKHAGERSRSPKRDAEPGRRKFEWRREPAPDPTQPREPAYMQPFDASVYAGRRYSARGGSQPHPHGRMDRPRHATSGGEQPRARQDDRSRPPEPMGSSSNRRGFGRWTEPKPAAGMGTGGWSHDDRQARQAAGSNGQTSAGGADWAGGNKGRSDQVDRWQRDMLKGPTARRAPAVDEARRSAFANFEF